jgi:Putative transposase/Transposase zinc-binding domain
MSLELQDIFEQFGSDYRKNHPLPLHQLKVMKAIESCRTSNLGGHVDVYDSCGHERISYNSCRNRHCPKCQGLAKEQWLRERDRDLLEVGYFHVVFTVPNSLNPIALQNQRLFYSLLFKAASETIAELSRDPKYLGAEIGFISVLHTWGQNLMDHPHVHSIVPGGGLSFDGTRWISSRKKFFIPIKILSRKFRGKFLAFFKEAYQDGLLQFYGKIEPLSGKLNFQKLIDNLYKTDWVVFCKKPFKSPWHVLRYLGRYTHRVAISNQRIVSLQNGQVTFTWRDYKDGNKTKLMILEVSEFIRRFLLHVLPSRFVKIRHYGILGNRNRNRKLRLCQRLTFSKSREVQKLSSATLLFKLTGLDLRICPSCGNGTMIRKLCLDPQFST